MSFEIDIDTSSESKTDASDCPGYGSKPKCLSSTIQSCVIPCQTVVTALYNTTDNAVLVASQDLASTHSTMNNICGSLFANMDACIHCSRSGFGLSADNFYHVLLPWSITCSTWMNHGPVRAYECWQGYASNKTTACDPTMLLQVANMGLSVLPASKSALLAGLSIVAFFGLNL